MSRDSGHPKLNLVMMAMADAACQIQNIDVKRKCTQQSAGNGDYASRGFSVSKTAYILS